MRKPSAGERRTNGWFSRRGLLAFTVGVFLFAGAVGWFWQWRYGLPPEIDGPATMNRLTAEHFGDLAFDSPDNAVVHYRTIFVDVFGLPGAVPNWYSDDAGNALLKQWRAARRAYLLPNLVQGEWDDDRQENGKRLLPVFRTILDPLDRAADARGFRPRYSPSGDIFNPDDSGGPIGPIDILLPHLGPFRALSELNTTYLREAANNDDWAGVTRRVRTGMGHARNAAHEPFFISSLVALSIEAGTLQELRFTINEHDIPVGACDALIAELERVPHADLAFAQRTESIAFPSVIRYTFVGETGGMFSPGYWRAIIENPPPRAAMRDGERFHNEMHEYIALPPAERVSKPMPDAGAAAYYLPGFSRVIDQFDSVVTLRAATIALLRLERFHAQHGRWPATLTEAMPVEQATDPVTGGRFLYLVGSDGLRPETASDNETPFVPSDMALAQTRTMTFEAEEQRAGPRWPFTLLAPTEASFMNESEFTTRRGVIVEPPANAVGVR